MRPFLPAVLAVALGLAAWRGGVWIAAQLTDGGSVSSEPWCGNGVLDEGEECDEFPPVDWCVGCVINENEETAEGAYCGNGVQEEGEDCDTGGENNEGAESATCDSDCTPAVCGDGYRNAAAGEQCDDGNTDDGDGCSSTCMPAYPSSGPCEGSPLFLDKPYEGHIMFPETPCTDAGNVGRGHYIVYSDGQATQCEDGQDWGEDNGTTCDPYASAGSQCVSEGVRCETDADCNCEGDLVGTYTCQPADGDGAGGLAMATSPFAAQVIGGGKVCLPPLVPNCLPTQQKGQLCTRTCECEAGLDCEHNPNNPDEKVCQEVPEKDGPWYCIYKKDSGGTLRPTCQATAFCPTLGEMRPQPDDGTYYDLSEEGCLARLTNPATGESVCTRRRLNGCLGLGAGAPPELCRENVPNCEAPVWDSGSTGVVGAGGWYCDRWKWGCMTDYLEPPFLGTVSPDGVTTSWYLNGEGGQEIPVRSGWRLGGRLDDGYDTQNACSAACSGAARLPADAGPGAMPFGGDDGQGGAGGQQGGQFAGMQGGGLGGIGGAQGGGAQGGGGQAGGDGGDQGPGGTDGTPTAGSSQVSSSSARTSARGSSVASFRSSVRSQPGTSASFASSVSRVSSAGGVSSPVSSIRSSAVSFPSSTTLRSSAPASLVSRASSVASSFPGSSAQSLRSSGGASSLTVFFSQPSSLTVAFEQSSVPPAFFLDGKVTPVRTRPTEVLAGRSVCGDAVVDLGEECDDGNLRDLDGCSQQCLRERGRCGDGTVQSLLDEQCEPAVHAISAYACGPDCRFRSPLCGNGTVDPGEQCDGGAGNSNAPNAFCRPDCGLARCGDGITDTATETCDDKNRVSGDGCSARCARERAAPSPLTAQLFSFPPSQPAPVVPPPLAQAWQAVPPAVASSGPASLAVMAAGAASGVAWIRRKRKRE